MLLPVVVAVTVSLVYALAFIERRFQRFERLGREENVRIGCRVDWGWRNGVARMNPENRNKFVEIRHKLRSIEYLLLNFSSIEMSPIKMIGTLKNVSERTHGLLQDC